MAIRKRGASYVVDVYVRGERRRLTFPTKFEAEQAQKEHRLRKLIHKGMALEMVEERFIDDVFDYFFESFSTKLSKTSMKNDAKVLREMHEFFFERGVSKISEVRYVDLVEFQSVLRERVAASTVNRKFVTVKRVFQECVNAGFRADNPAQRVKDLEESPNPRQTWTDHEMDLVISKLPRLQKLMFLFFVETGARPAEIRRFRWSDYDKAKGVITLTCGKNADKRRHLALTPLAASVLEKLERGPSHQLVFGVDPASLQKRIYALSEELNMKGMCIYGLRHSFASRLVDQNMNVEFIRKLMGHTDIKTTQRYFRKREAEELRDVVALASVGNLKQQLGKLD